MLQVQTIARERMDVTVSKDLNFNIEAHFIILG